MDCVTNGWINGLDADGLAAVESCLSHGLRRRALGLFRSSSTTALMHKVAKGYPPAETVSKLIVQAEATHGIKYIPHLHTRHLPPPFLTPLY